MISYRIRKNEHDVDDKNTRHASSDKHPKRHVYDCQETEQTRRKLMRDEGDPPTNDDVNRAYDYSGFTLKYLNDVLKKLT